MFADSLTIFGGILSGPVAFLGFMFLIILFISSIFAVGMSNLVDGESMWFLMFIILLIFVLFNDIFYSTVVLIRITLGNWWYT